MDSFMWKEISNVQTLASLYGSLGQSTFCIAVCLKKDGYSIMTWDHAIRQFVNVSPALVPAKCWIMLQGTL